MDIEKRRAELEKRRQELVEIIARAQQMAQQASVEMCHIDGALSILNELEPPKQ